MTSPIFRNSILTRAELRPAEAISPLQSQVDGLVGGFAEQATDWRSLAAMTAGGMAYRAGRIGVMGLGNGSFLRAVSVGLGLTAEVSTFELSNRLLQGGSSSLWRWNGNGGLRQGLLQSFVTFGALKGAGRLAQGENLIAQHLFQDAAMVLGHQATAALGIAPRPTGTLAEQFLHAEATNLQLGAGLALAHRFAPGIHGWEGGLDLSLRTMDVGAGFPHPQFMSDRRGGETPPLRMQPVLVVAGGSGIGREIGESSRAEPRGPTNFQMSSVKGAEGGGKKPDFSPPSMEVHPFKGSDAFYEVIDRTLENLPKGTSCLVIELNTKSLNNMGALADRLLQHPTLQEIRIRYAEGTLKWFVKDGERVLTEEEDGEAGWWFEDSSKGLLRLGLLAPWTPLQTAEPFHELIRRLRLESGFPSLNAAVREANERWGFPLSRHLLGIYERHPDHVPSFEGLWMLSRLYRADLFDLIEASNRSRHPRVDPKSWRSSYYPILIERAADLRRLEFFEKTDPSRRSFGWLLFSARKNPFAYVSGNELSKKTLVSPQHLWDLELNRYEASGPVLSSLSNALRLSESALVRSLNETFHRSLRGPLRLLFPGRPIFIDPQSEDESRVRSYLAAPGSIGQVLFEHRKSLPEFLSVLDMERRVKMPLNWDGRERNQVPVTEQNWAEWVGLFEKARIPLSKLHPFLKKIEVSPKSARYELARAMGGMTLDELSSRSGVAEVSLRPLLRATSASPELDTLQSLKRTLPNLPPRFFRDSIKSFTSFFPESATETPVIHLSRSQIDPLFRLRLGERLYEHRMETNLGKVEMGRVLGVSALGVDKYERGVCDIDDAETLINLSRVLNLDRKVLYLYYHPEVLEFFPVLETDSGRPLSVQTVAPTRSAALLRLELRNAMGERGLKNADELRGFLNLPETPEGRSKARKFFELLEPLNSDEILQLTRGFGLSLRSWYEHYYGSTLAYFLGKNGDGSFRYGFPPEAPSWEALERFDVFDYVTKALFARYPSYTQAFKALRSPYLQNAVTIRRGIEGKSWKEETLARLARDLNLDRRLLFFYFRSEELKKILGADTPPHSSGGSPSSIQASRLIRSTEGTEYPFELFLPSFTQVLSAEPGTEFPMAQRGAHPLLLEMGSREETPVSNSFFPAGTPVYRYILKEGNTRGVAVIMDEPGVISAFALDTTPTWGAAPKMAPGAGSIAMEWLATQAALNGKELHLLHIENYQILNILNRQGLLDPESIQVEACRWKNQEFQLFDVEETFSLSDTQALRRNMTPDFWNVLGRPHPRLAKGLIDPLILGNTPRR